MSRLLVVSNRLPITVEWNGDKPEIRPSSGGLVSALNSLFQHHSGAWIGWPGISSLDPRVAARWPSTPQMQMVPVFLTEQERQGFYCGFSNEIIWPLFHDLQSRCNFDPSYWKAYVEVNRRFTNVVLEQASPGDLVWVHDYHLALVGSMLRQQHRDLTVAYFQHIPFPSLDIFEKLPWGAEMLRALLQFEVIGFQTERDLRNFATCVRRFRIGRVRRSGDVLLIEHANGVSQAKAFPISIDFDHFESDAKSEDVEQRVASMRAEFGNRRVILGVDRLDYTKGIPERLRGFSRALELFELRKTTSFVQVVVPSRENIPRYKDLKMEIERLVSEINGRFTEAGWVPIHFIYRHLERSELLSYYRLADVALITPLKDGMNLVCKEYCAADIEEDGTLIISQFAGAAEQLAKQALSVNPNDYDQVAHRIHDAISMGYDERRRRMSYIRTTIRRFNVHQWAESFLLACTPASNESQPPATTEQNRSYFAAMAG